MGVDIFYFANHDLPTDSAENFVKEFSKRVNGNVELYDWSHDCDDCDKNFYKMTVTECSTNKEEVMELSFPNHSKFMKNNKWYICYDHIDGVLESNFPNPKGDIKIHFTNDDVDVNVELAKQTLFIWNIKKNWDKEINFCRWHTMNDFFSYPDKVQYAKEWQKKLISQIKEVLTPVFHCSKVLLVKDNMSDEHEKLWGTYIMEKGDSLEEALNRNNNFKEPCAILRNEEAFYHNQDLNQPFYVFNF